MKPATPATLTKKQQRQADVRRRRAEAEDARRRKDEEAAEAIAPRAQRHNHVKVTMLQDDGSTATGFLVGARWTMERTAMGTMRAQRTSTAAKLHDAQKHRAAEGQHVTISEEHVKATEKLRADFDVAGGGIGLGNSDLLNKSAARTAPGSGISEAKVAAVLEQTDARRRLEGALTYVGGSADIVVALELMGVSINAWAQARGWDRKHAVGYLAGALDRLAEFYAGGKSVGIVFMKLEPGEKS